MFTNRLVSTPLRGIEVDHLEILLRDNILRTNVKQETRISKLIINCITLNEKKILTLPTVISNATQMQQMTSPRLCRPLPSREWQKIIQPQYIILDLPVTSLMREFKGLPLVP